MTQPDTPHTRLRDEINRRLAVARAATPGPWRPGIDDTGLVWVEQEEGDHTVADVGACADHPDRQLNDAAHVALFNPAAIMAWLEAELEVLERHKPEIRNVEWWDAPDVGKAPVCPTCAVAEPHEWDLGVGNYGVKPDGWVSAYILAPCAEIRSLAHRLGVSIDV